MGRGKIILISGTSSSGKSTLAEGLQKSLAEPFLHVQLDAFIEMLPRTDDWQMFRRMVRGMNRSVAALADEGNNLIVDHVLVDDAWLRQLLDLLRGTYVLFVGLSCPLDELERRERGRDARRQGFARQQFESIHRGKLYDLELDTSAAGPEECVGRVLEFYRRRRPSAFARMRRAAGGGTNLSQRRVRMGQGGDRGKGPNETGTQPVGRKKAYPNPKAGKGASGQGAGKARQGGPKKVAARTTKKSRDK